jgi:polysaccharide export outer membrane protein
MDARMIETRLGRSELRAATLRMSPLLLLGLLSACSSLGAAGPTARAVEHARRSSVAQAPIQVVDVNDAVARRVLATNDRSLFSTTIGDAPVTQTVIGRGDVLELTIWEAPPAALFGGNVSFGTSDTKAVIGSAANSGQNAAIPSMTVDADGQIRVPFAGVIQAAGRTPQQVEREIVRRLSGMAHEPQVAVRIVNNASSNVMVVGDVATNARVPLSPKGERVLDALASAGGVKQPVGKMTVQITRGDRVARLPLEAVIRDPSQNIRLAPNDVVTALYQPFSFTALGATNKSAEVPFESTGLSLAEALGRLGGLRDDRADARGVFIFRLENPAALDPVTAASAPRTPDGRIPVVYRIDLKDPATLFAAQSFPIRDKDVLYVSTAPLADFQRFVTMASSMAFSFIGLGQAVP